MRRFSPRLLIGALVIASLSTSVASAAAGSGPQNPGPPEGLKAGDRLEDHGVALTIAPAGNGVGAEAIAADGSTQLLEAETLPNGHVVVRHWGDDRSGGDGSSGAGGLPPLNPTQCTDDNFNIKTWYWATTYRWEFNSGSTPAEMTVADAEAKLVSAARNIVNSRNECAISDYVEATQYYVGRGTRGTNIDANNNCTTRDTYSVASFGDISSNFVGYACWWFNTSTNEAQEVDIKLNKVEHKWYRADTATSCSDKWSVEAVATHEFGHAFGLEHVYETNSPNLTMSQDINGKCQDSESTLGYGDVLGLQRKY